MNATSIRNCGRALLGVFVITVIGVLLPLDLKSPGWGIRLSTIVIDAASLPLVGLLLMRYAVHLEVESANAFQQQETQTDSNWSALDDEEPFDPLEADDELSRLTATDPYKGVRKLAFIGFTLLILLAIWQFFLAMRSLDLIDRQDITIYRQIDARFENIEKNISNAPPEAIAKAWGQSQNLESPGIPTSQKDSLSQRREILNQIEGQKLQAYENLVSQKSKNQFNLSRDIVRVILMAIIYGWAFYGISKL
jgi:hypothetical protein